MTSMIKKRIIVCSFLVLVCMANAQVLVAWLDAGGVLPLATHVCDHYLKGTAVTVILVFLFVTPSKSINNHRCRRCRVCGAELTRRGKYCSACGSRV